MGRAGVGLGLGRAGAGDGCRGTGRTGTQAVGARTASRGGDDVPELGEPTPTR